MSDAGAPACRPKLQSQIRATPDQAVIEGTQEVEKRKGPKIEMGRPRRRRWPERRPR